MISYIKTQTKRFFSTPFRIRIFPFLSHSFGSETTNTLTAISRKIVGKNVHATIPKGNKGYDQHTVPHTAAVQPHPGGGGWGGETPHM